jgi:hypothetical protein
MKQTLIAVAFLSLGAIACQSDPSERWQGQRLKLVLSDSFLVKTIGNLRLVDQHPVTKNWLLFDLSDQRILITDPKGTIQREIAIGKDGSQAYGMHQLYNLAFYGDSSIVLTSVKGLFIVNFAGKTSYQYPEVINKSPNRQYSLASFREGEREYLVGIVKYAPRPPGGVTSRYIVSREYALNYRSLTVFDRQANKCEVIIPYEPDGEMLAGGHYHEDFYTYADFDTTTKRFYLLHNPDPKVYAYTFSRGAAKLDPASSFVLQPMYFKRPMQVEFGQTKFDLTRFVVVNAMFTSFKLKGDSCLVQYKTGIPDNDYQPGMSSLLLDELVEAKKKNYLQVYHLGQLIAPDIEMPPYLGKIIHWAADGKIAFQTDQNIREHKLGTMFYFFRLTKATR